MKRAAVYVGLPLAGVVSAWQVLAQSKREARRPMARARTVMDMGTGSTRTTFFGGSADDAFADALRTGDVLLFSHDCALKPPLGAGLCAAAKHAAGGGRDRFDHVGIVIMRNFVPHVLEVTFSGVRVRPYDQRVAGALADQVVLRRLRREPATAAASAPAAVVEEYVTQCELRYGSGAGTELAEFTSLFREGALARILAGTPLPPPLSKSAAVVGGLLQLLGALPPDADPESLTPADFASGAPHRDSRRLPLEPELLLRSR